MRGVTVSPDAPGDQLEQRSLDHLVGTWTMTGGAEGSIRYEWMDGGYCVIQHVALTQFG